MLTRRFLQVQVKSQDFEEQGQAKSQVFEEQGQVKSQFFEEQGQVKSQVGSQYKSSLCPYCVGPMTFTEHHDFRLGNTQYQHCG